MIKDFTRCSLPAEIIPTVSFLSVFFLHSSLFPFYSLSLFPIFSRRRPPATFSCRVSPPVVIHRALNSEIFNKAPPVPLYSSSHTARNARHNEWISERIFVFPRAFAAISDPRGSLNPISNKPFPARGLQVEARVATPQRETPRDSTCSLDRTKTSMRDIQRARLQPPDNRALCKSREKPWCNIHGCVDDKTDNRVPVFFEPVQTPLKYTYILYD